uniref:Uncharacterized protein n=1 Tax=Grammatophora oceanica TaxID=210454 RepID=A0A7S1Y8H2_9STRA|mmetsp:Transcript_32083/g.47720  ORF Transcript_32083/g.47720 Transcript_32083/m.47720 type:complete len:460 (+) Transcript_32083:1-1380(+)
MRATLSHLRRLTKPEGRTERNIIVASMDRNVEQHSMAILAAAAFCTWEIDDSPSDDDCQGDSASIKLLLGSTEHSMASFWDFLHVLDRVLFGKLDADNAPSFMTSEGNATTKAIINLLDRHLAEDQLTLLLVGSQDLALPRDVLEDLSKRNCRIHCHDSDDMCARLLREEAKKGDITISLAWDTEDDLDLHVFVPGGEEIFYGRCCSRSGLCHLDVDMNAGGPLSKEPVENVFCGDLVEKKQAPLGRYKVVVENFGFHTKGPRSRKIPFRVTVEMNGKKHKYEGETKGGSGKKSSAVVCVIDYKGRSIPFPDDGDTPLTAFGTSNLLNITSSSGQTLEALCQFVEVIRHHQKLEEVKEWLAQDDEAEGREVVTALTAETGQLDVTSYDRLQILLAKLPARFHLVVDEAFGSAKLWDHCARSLARQMLRDRIPLSKLSEMGWPEEIVPAVREHLYHALSA